MTTAEATKRSRASKRRGADFETDLVTLLREAGLDVERLTKTGREDEGDLVVKTPDGSVTVVEAKNEKSIDLPGYLREAFAEEGNYIKHRPGLNPDAVEAVAIVKARGRNARKAYVVSTVERFFGLDGDSE